MEIHLPKRVLQGILESFQNHTELNRKDNFYDLRDLPQQFQDIFKCAWKAIERGSLEKLKNSVKRLKDKAKETPYKKSCLDVCYLQSVVSKSVGVTVVYYMTLLAHAVIRGERSMVDLLIKLGADPKAGNGLSGTPLTQALVHCRHNDSSGVIDCDIIEYLIKDFECTDLEIEIMDFISITHRRVSCCSVIEIAINARRMDVVKAVVRKGTNPVCVKGDPSKYTGVVQLFEEYYEFGTNEYITWLVQEYLSEEKIPEFISDVMKVNILEAKGMEMFERVGRHPAHAILTSGHKGLIEKFLEINGRDLLTKQDKNGRTALQVSAVNGDLESVTTILDLIETHVSDKFDQGDSIKRKWDCENDVAKSMLAAARSGYPDVVKHIFGWYIAQMKRFLVGLSPIIFTTALKEGLSSIFEAIRDLGQEHLLRFKFDNGNTLGHKAASSGDAGLFKILFPLTSLQKEDLTKYVNGQFAVTEPKYNIQYFAALLRENDDHKTPLHIAVEDNCLLILKTLEDYVKERESRPSADTESERMAWDEIWNLLGKELLLYACSYGSVDSVRLLVGMNCLHKRYSKVGGNPISNAAMSGKDEILQYLLDLKKDIIDSNKNQALLDAAKNGRTRCVKILLDKGAAVDHKEGDNNCLTLAIENDHRETVLTIVKHKQGIHALKFLPKEKGKSILCMLIENMPDVAEWILNECALHKHEDVFEVDTTDGGRIEDDHGLDGTTDSYNNKIGYMLIEHGLTTPKKHNRHESEAVRMQSDGEDEADSATTQSNTHVNDRPLVLMVDYDRENLLSHPIVRQYIRKKWWKIGLPGLVAYILFYFVFLSLLTGFALAVPNPLVQNKLCNEMLSPAFAIDDNLLPNSSENNYTDISLNDNYCEEQSIATVIYLYFAAVLVIILALINIALEVVQFFNRKKNYQYFKEIENYLQLLTYISCIIFVSPAGQECWCFPLWKWQIGVVALFLAWLNGIILMKDLPFIGEPVTMLLNVYLNFLKLIYLPFLLILTFGFPAYMLFTRESIEEGNSTSITLSSFATPYIAPVKVLVQTAGEIDFENMFNRSPLLYPALSYFLIILFVIAMPILFNNFLIGLAIGEIDKQQKKASLTRIKTKIKFIFEVQDTVKRFRSFLKRVKFICCHKRNQQENRVQQNKEEASTKHSSRGKKQVQYIGLVDITESNETTDCDVHVEKGMIQTCKKETLSDSEDREVTPLCSWICKKCKPRNDSKQLKRRLSTRLWKMDDEQIKQLHADQERLNAEFESKEHAEDMKQSVNSLVQQLSKTQQHLTEVQEQTKETLKLCKTQEEDLKKLKDDLAKAMKLIPTLNDSEIISQSMRSNHQMLPTQEDEWELFKDIPQEEEVTVSEIKEETGAAMKAKDVKLRSGQQMSPSQEDQRDLLPQKEDVIEAKKEIKVPKVEDATLNVIPHEAILSPRIAHVSATDENEMPQQEEILNDATITFIETEDDEISLAMGKDHHSDVAEQQEDL